MKNPWHKIRDLLKKRFGKKSPDDAAIQEMPARKATLGSKIQELTGQFARKHLSKGLALTQKIPNDLWGEKIFSPDSRPFIHRLFLVMVGVIFSYGIGKFLSYSIALLWTNTPPKVIMPPVVVERTASEFLNYEDILQANLFNAAIESQGNMQLHIDEKILCERSDRLSTLPLRLLSTIVMQNPMKSLASIQMGQREIKNLREGEKIPGQLKVDQIGRLRIVVKNLQNGECEYMVTKDLALRGGRSMKVLSPEEGSKMMEKYRREGIDNEGENFNITKGALNKYLGSIDQILMQARAIQIVNPDGSISFKVTDIVPGSLYSALGLQNEDIIQEINGKKIHSLNEVMNMFAKIQSIENLQIKVTKEDGEERVLDYNIHP